MTSFSLELQLGRECSCEAKCLEAMSVSTPTNSLDKLLILESETISLFAIERAEDSNSTTATALFLPPAFIDEWLKGQTFSLTNNICCCLQEKHYIGIQNSLVSQIHSSLPGHCRIRSLLRCRGNATISCTSDFLLLDISQEQWKICGDPMVSSLGSVIKLLHVSIDVVARPKNVASRRGPRCEIPTCAVCLHRIYPPRLGMPKPRNDQLCSEYCTKKSFTNDIDNNNINNDSAGIGGCNEAFLKPWPKPTECKACHLIQNYWSATNDSRSNELDDVFCYCCALPETLWICLTCGYVGCGRYSQAHAEEHFQQSQHAFSLEMATLRIWDYATGEFAHRGDLLECPSVREHHPQLANVILPWDDEGESIKDQTKLNNNGFASLNNSNNKPPKKTTMIGEEYEALIQSALEDQAHHYEGEISRLHAALTAERIDTNTMTTEETLEIEQLKNEIQELRDEGGAMGRSLLDMQAQEAGHRAASQRLLREQNIAKDLLDKIREEAEKEHEQGGIQLEELEHQVADLTANLRMRQQIAQDEELNNAQIYGTMTTSKQSSSRRGNRKSRRNGRK